MLEHTFCHIRGLGRAAEVALWSAGITTWEQALLADRLPLAPRQAAAVRDQALASTAKLADGDPGFFHQRLPSREEWRLFPSFRPVAAYLDIETTGLGSPGDHVTSVVLYDGRTVHAFVHGQNMADFAACVAQYQLLVTYNGKSFDLPFLRRCLGLELAQAHIDLRYLLGGLGYRGGLKGCERQLGLMRPGLEDVDGYFAVLLWNEYQCGREPQALETLLAYNTMDVLHLEALMVLACNERLGQTPFATERLARPVLPANPYQADPALIRRIRRRYGLA